MTTFDDLKQKYFDHLASMDLAAMSVSELATYGCILHSINEMLKPSYAEQMATMLPLMTGCACKMEAGGDG